MKTLISILIEEEIKANHNLNETAEQFVSRIAELAKDEILSKKLFSPRGLDKDVKEEIQQVVLEVYRAKTYGYLTLQSYRLAFLLNNSKQKSKSNEPSI